jgi:GNAT superfamily N-acetyltransferase
MVNTERTDANNPQFRSLIKLLDAELAIRDGEEHAFYNQFNQLDNIKHVMLAYQQGEAVACGAIKMYNEEAVEVKRMYCLPTARGQGVASVLLQALEAWATELGFTQSILETGINQPEAIRLYEKNGYERIPNYGQYAGVEASFCFKKHLVAG